MIPHRASCTGNGHVCILFFSCAALTPELWDVIPPLDVSLLRKDSRMPPSGPRAWSRPSLFRKEVNEETPRRMCGRVTGTERGRWNGQISADGNDGTRLRYDLQHCQLKRFTASEARQCLRGKHLVLVGDSLMRYQYLSLVHFLHLGEYPPSGVPESKADEPNICMEGDYWRLSDEWKEKFGISTGGWPAFMIATSQLFEGTERCDCYRDVFPFNTTVENRYFRNSDYNVSVSYFTKLGGAIPDIRGHYPLSLEGTMPPKFLTETIYKKLGKTPLNWNVDNEEFVTKILPAVEKDQGKVSHLLWNEGIWMHESDWNPLMRTVRSFMEERQVRAFFKTTTGPGLMNRSDWETWVPSRDRTGFKAALENGWEVLDTWGAVKDLTLMADGLDWRAPGLPSYPLPLAGDPSIQVEFNAIHWDIIHFKPWVYEEINNLWLNMVCDDTDDDYDESFIWRSP